MVEPITMTIRSTARSYLEVVFHRKMLIVIPVIFGTLIAWGYSFTVAPMYQSSAIIQVAEKARENPFIKGAAMSTPLSARIGAVIQMVKSRNTIEEVIKELDLARNIRSPGEYNRLVNDLRANITVSIRRDNFIEVSCSYPTAQETRDIVNSITRKIIKQNLESQELETETGIEYLNNEIELYKRKLEENEDQIQKFREANAEYLPEELSTRIYNTLTWTDPYSGEEQAPPFNEEALRRTDPGGVLGFQARYQSYSTALLNQGRELKSMQKKRASLIGQMEGEDEFVLTQRVSETSPVIRSLRGELTQKQIELARLKVDATEDHPMVQRLTREISNIQDSIRSAAEQSVREETTALNPIYQAIRMELSRIDSDIESLKEQIEITSQMADEAFLRLQQVPQIQKEITRLQRESAILSQRYTNLIAARERAYISRRLELQERGTKFNIIDDAQVPLKPFKPNRGLIVIAGFFAGLVLGGALVVLAEVTDHSFEEANQLREFLPVPMLGAVSQIVTPEEKAFVAAKKRLGFLGLGIFVVLVVLVAIVVMIFGPGGQG